MSVVIVGLREGFDRAEVIAALLNEGLDVKEVLGLPLLLTVSGTTAETFSLKGYAAIEFVEDDADVIRPAEYITIRDTPDYGPWPLLRHTRRDPPWPTLGLRLPFTAEFECVRTGRNVDIYIVDTGLRPTHAEFSGRATVLDPDFEVLHSHGTSCLSCAAGKTLGAAREAELFSAAGLRNANNTGSTSDIISAIGLCRQKFLDRAGLNRPGILNLSLSGGTTAYSSAIRQCTSVGLIVCAAAANDQSPLSSTSVFPAKDFAVITVGGIDMADGPYAAGSSGTNYGNEIDILAGSQYVRVAGIESDTAQRTGSGTSYGTPHVVGALACILQDYDRLQDQQQVLSVCQYLYDTATFGRYVRHPRFEPMNEAILYFDPGPGPYPDVPGLTKRRG